MHLVGSTPPSQKLNEENTPPRRKEEKNPPPSSLQTSVPTKREKAKIRIEFVEVHRAITVGAYEGKRPQKTNSDRPKYLVRPNTQGNIHVTNLAASHTNIAEEDSITTADLITGGAPLPTTGLDAGAQQFTVSPKASPAEMRLPNILPQQREKSTSTGSWAGKKVEKSSDDRLNITLSPRGPLAKSKFPSPAKITLHTFNELPPILEGNPVFPAEVPTTAPRPTEHASTTSNREEPPEVARVQRNLSKRDKAKTLTRRDVGFQHITQHITPPAPDSSKELATLIEVLIRKNPSPVMGVVRVLNMFRCALGGTISPDPTLPETGECAAKLSNLLQDQRYEHLQALYDQCEFYLLPLHRELISFDLERLKNQNVSDRMMADLTITRLAFFIDQEIVRINK